LELSLCKVHAIALVHQGVVDSTALPAKFNDIAGRQHGLAGRRLRRHLPAQ
jgi:hypothetical protein